MSPTNPTRRRNDRGAVAIEFALVFPLLLLLIFGSFELGLATQDRALAANAAREGARAASLGGNDSDVDAAVRSVLGTTAADIAANCSTSDSESCDLGTAGGIATVTVTITYTGLTGWIPGLDHLQISQSNSMRIER